MNYKADIQAIRETIKAGDMPHLQQLVEEGIRKYPESAEIWASCAIIMVNAGHTEDAEAAARRALEINPACPDALIAMSNVCRLRGETGKALDWERKAAAVHPAARGVVLIREAAIAAARGRPDGALKYLDEAISCPIASVKATALDLKTRLLLDWNKPEEAQNSFDELKRVGYSSESMFTHEARILAAQDRFDEAVAVLRSGLERYSGSYTLIYWLLQLLHDAGQAEEENKLIAEILANPPQTSADCAALVSMLDNIGRESESHQLLEQSRERFPDARELTHYKPDLRSKLTDTSGARFILSGIWASLSYVAKKLWSIISPSDRR